jgi:queuine tRNA-ribosyltransferase
MRGIATAHGEIPLPAFLPDATQAVVKTVDATDVAACGVPALMVNVLHLASHPGTSVIARFGGVHRFMGWDGPIASDSGGFQAFSLVAGSRKLGRISKDGFTYRFDKALETRTLTPEKSVRKQFQLGADILFCLDHCTHPDAPLRDQQESVEHTVAWARQCKAEFERRVEQTNTASDRPLLFAIVQGGASPELRRMCAERLLEIGFNGYGYGGWPVDDTGALVEMVAHVSELIPATFPKHALGIGKPENVVRAFAQGYRLFDCVIPTRDARHKRLYAFEPDWEQRRLEKGDFYRHLYMQDAKHARDQRPVEEGCDCLCCRRYPRAYLYHLFEIEDPVALRLATIHNLRFYARLMERLRAVRVGT